jgi:hypothetical protein
MARQPVSVAIRQCLVEAAKRGPVGEALHGVFDHLQHRGMSVWIDLGWNSPVIGGEPVLP